MATQLRLLENQPLGTSRSENSRAEAEHVRDELDLADEVVRTPIGRSARRGVRRTPRRGSATGGSRSAMGPVREPLDVRTRERGLRGVEEARRALSAASRRVAIREAERRTAKQAQLVELAGRASVIASSPVASSPATPHVPDGNAAA